MTWTKARIPLLEVSKWLVFVLLALFLYAITAQGRESGTDFSAMTSAVTQAADLTPMQEADGQMVKRLYGLDPNDYEGVLLYYPTTNMGAEELLVIKLRDTTQQEAVTAAIDARMASQMSNFDGYGVGQYEVLEKRITEVRGNYILLVVASDPTPVQQAFLKAL